MGGLIEAELRAHDERMARGCTKCGEKRVGRVCPDCYRCRTCRPGCHECSQVIAAYRRSNKPSPP